MRAPHFRLTSDFLPISYYDLIARSLYALRQADSTSEAQAGNVIVALALGYWEQRPTQETLKEFH